MLIIYTGHSFLIGYSDLPVPHRLSRVKLPCCVFLPSSGPTPWYWLLTLEFTFRVCGPESGFLIPFLSKWSSFFHESQKLWQQYSTGTDISSFIFPFLYPLILSLISIFATVLDSRCLFLIFLALMALPPFDGSDLVVCPSDFQGSYRCWNVRLYSRDSMVIFDSL